MIIIPPINQCKKCRCRIELEKDDLLYEDKEKVFVNCPVCKTKLEIYDGNTRS